MTWHNVKEIRVREHTARSRPGSRPCLMVVYSLEGRDDDCFDFLAFESDKAFAREKAGSRWLELRGEVPIPETTAEASEREGELCVPLRVFLTKDGDWERVTLVSFEEEKEPEPDASLEDDRKFLMEERVPPQFDFSRFKGGS